ncbi:hypothetical protein F0U60_37510 [Archangium minus]|uniref:Uncharacterized protein n=1 Tax=Archangium minus TaxID=83450 RepID=A0ABY9X1B0_9BACT|nr:hypothetical protein F0U60_37510 [Archangium minus]
MTLAGTSPALPVNMTTRTDRESLAARLARAEVELQQAQRGLDGSPQARTRYARARAEHEAAELAARAEFARESHLGA